MSYLTHFSLFTGIGGIDLAAEWAGFRTVGMCERDPYCRRVLAKHWPDVSVWEDVRDVTRESVAALYDPESQRCNDGADGAHAGTSEAPFHAPAMPDTGRSGEAAVLVGADQPAVTLVSGGFPCQPFSVAGKRRGEEDDRHLWPEMLRVIKDLRPTWVLGENVGGFVGMVLDLVLSDLEGAGYEARAFVLPACAVNAPHRRDRCFIVGHPRERRLSRLDGWWARQEPTNRCLERGAWAVADAAFLTEREPADEAHAFATSGRTRQESRRRSWWEPEPSVGRVAHGVPSRVDRLRALGNAVVPQQVYPILKVIADIEWGGGEWSAVRREG